MLKLLDHIRLERAALARWAQELELREQQVMRWLEVDESSAAEESRKETK
jgi:hypothetical protein